MEGLPSNVTFSVSPRLDLENKLKLFYRKAFALFESKGYELGYYKGYRLNRDVNKNSFTSDGFGILKRSTLSKTESFVELLGFDRAFPAKYVGRVLLHSDGSDDQSGKENFERNWSLEIYGRDNVQSLTELVGTLARDYPNVSVAATLKSEEALNESVSGCN